MTRDSEKFTTQFPDVPNFIGNFDFGLSSKGEFLRLYDSTGILVDSVFYLPTSPWPSAANGTGPSLELISPDSDNALPENWTTFSANGTPGSANGVYTSVNTISELAAFITIHPNPFGEQIRIKIDLPKSSDLQIDLLTINGQVIQQLVPSQHIKQAQFEFALSALIAGNYLIRVLIDGEQVVKKIIKQ